MKKKILVLTLIAAMMVIFVSCGMGAIVGEWTQTGMDYNGETYDLTKDAYKDVVATLTVTEDGKYSLASNNTSYDGKWTKDGRNYKFNELDASIGKDKVLTLVVGDNCTYYFEKK